MCRNSGPNLQRWNSCNGRSHGAAWQRLQPMCTMTAGCLHSPLRISCINRRHPGWQHTILDSSLPSQNFLSVPLTIESTISAALSNFTLPCQAWWCDPDCCCCCSPLNSHPFKSIQKESTCFRGEWPQGCPVLYAYSLSRWSSISSLTLGVINSQEHLSMKY